MRFCTLIFVRFRNISEMRFRGHLMRFHRTTGKSLWRFHFRSLTLNTFQLSSRYYALSCSYVMRFCIFFALS